MPTTQTPKKTTRSKAASVVKKAIPPSEKSVLAKKTSSLKAPVFDISGSKKNDISLPEDMFGAPVSKVLLAQYVRVYLANQKPKGAYTKTRSEVTGSTRKIYRQKGTGRARHGAIKAPIFVGGGVAHGPKALKKTLTLNKKQKKQALYSALSMRFKDADISFVEGLLTIQPKTKELTQTLKNLDLYKEKNLLVVYPSQNANNMILATRNVPNITLRSTETLNVFDVLRPKKILFTTEGLEVLKTRYHKAS